MLLETVFRFKPDLMVVVLFTEELNKETIKRISSMGDIITLNWFCDDHWRFEKFSKKWAPCFNWVITTDYAAIEKYSKIGVDNVILSQWACNHRLYFKMDLPKIYDVSFIGQPHGNRRQVINTLRKAGIDVRTWGYGWKEGKLTLREMVEVINQLKINLNLNKTSVPGHEQIKGRDFEIPGCGGFLLTGFSANIEEYYKIGEEIVCYSDIDDLVGKIRYYLQHNEEREDIAAHGYRRTLHDHTYDLRFKTIFREIGIG
jgi:spore maturation protein CgeB